MTLFGDFGATVGGMGYECTAGDVVMLPADLRHAERVGERGTRSIILVPINAGFDTWRDALPGFALLRGPEARRIVWRMAVEWETADTAAELALEHHFEEVADLLASVSKDTGSGRLPPGVRLAKELLRESLSRTPSLDEVARASGMSRAHLTRTFRRAVGCSVGTYLRRCRLDRAAQLLRETDRPIVEVGLSTGFYDQSHFTGAFGRWIGCPPGVFRKLMRP
jgi:AraC-like DNA-binding protein